MESNQAPERDLSEWTATLDEYELPAASGAKGWRWWAAHNDGREISSDDSRSHGSSDSLGHIYFKTKKEAEEDAVRSLSAFDALETRERIDGASLAERVRENA